MKVLSCLLFASFGLLIGCELVEDQTILSEDRKSVVNPVLGSEDFRVQNARHQVLVAVIDSGVDYLHPELRRHLHVQLDKDGRPLRWGWDFTGNDPWPSPLIGRSLDLDPRAEARDRWFAEHTVKMYQEGLSLVPELAPFLNPGRLHEAEASVFHGTHVAGLAVYDRPEIGLLAYRVLPLNRDPSEDWGATGTKMLEHFVSSLGQALRLAVKDGAKIVNLSLGMKPNEACLKEGFESEKCPEAERKIHAELKQIVLSSPNVVFVTAAGNSGEMILKNGLLPCGFEAPNLVCVGALDSRQSLADFSNLALQHKNFILAPGVEILSLMPTNVCRSESFPKLAEAGTYFRQSLEDRTQTWKQLLTACQLERPYGVASGTSMAAPLIARQLAVIALERPQALAADWVADLFVRSQLTEIQGNQLRRFEVEVPSWVAREGLSLYRQIRRQKVQPIPFYWGAGPLGHPAQ